MDSSDSFGLLSDSCCFSWNDVHMQIQKKRMCGFQIMVWGPIYHKPILPILTFKKVNNQL